LYVPKIDLQENLKFYKIIGPFNIWNVQSKFRNFQTGFRCFRCFNICMWIFKVNQSVLTESTINDMWICFPHLLSLGIKQNDDGFYSFFCKLSRCFFINYFYMLSYSLLGFGITYCTNIRMNTNRFGKQQAMLESRSK
jgi:hypothetical protein